MLTIVKKRKVIPCFMDFYIWFFAQNVSICKVVCSTDMQLAPQILFLLNVFQLIPSPLFQYLCLFSFLWNVYLIEVKLKTLLYPTHSLAEIFSLLGLFLHMCLCTNMQIPPVEFTVACVYDFRDDNFELKYL